MRTKPRSRPVRGHSNRSSTKGGLLQPLDNVVRPRVVVSIDGLPKTGKTTLALTAASTIAIVNLNFGLEYVASKFKDAGKDILTYDASKRLAGMVGMSTDERGMECDIIMKETEEVVQDALRTQNVRTILIDTGTELWEVARYGTIGSEGGRGVAARDYGDANAFMRRIIKAAYSTDHVSLIIVHHTKEAWANNKPTGLNIRDGWKNIGAEIQFSILTEVEETINRRTRRKQGETFYATIKECRINREMEMFGRLEGDMLNFPMIASMVTGIDIEEFE